MQQQEQQQTSGISTSNQAYIQSASFMMMRLDTRALVKDIKNFLASKEVYLKQDDKGEFYEEEEKIGRPLANEEGIMKICNIIRMRVNHHVAQGNFKEDHYWQFIMRARKELTETIIMKCYDWEIDDSDLNTVIDEICALIEAFLTRPIGNEERKSYSQQLAAREVITNNPKKNALQEFGGGLGNA